MVEQLTFHQFKPVFTPISDELGETRQSYSQKLLRTVISPRVIIAPDSDNMEPMIFAGDRLLIDTAETSIRNGKIYAIRYKTVLMIVKLHEHLDGMVILQNCNPQNPDQTISDAVFKEHIQVIGRVRERRGSDCF